MFKRAKTLSVVVVLVFSLALAVSPAKASIPNSSYLGIQTFTDNYYGANPCLASATDTPYGNTIAGWSQGWLCGGGFGPSSSNGVFGAWTQSVSSQSGSSSGGVTMTDTDYGSFMSGGQISYSGCFLGPQPVCDSGGNGNLIGSQSQSSAFTCSGPPCYTFYIPNYGQTLTPVDISTDVYVLGGLAASTQGTCIPFAGCFGSGNASVKLTILLNLKNSDNGQVSTMQIINDPLQCNTTGSSCAQSKDYSQDYTPSTSFLLPPGHYISILTITIQASSAAGIGGFGNAYSCFYISSNCLTGGELSSCPNGAAQTAGGYCQYVEWKYTQYTIHYPDFSVSTSPNSLSINAGSTASTTVSVTSGKVQNNNAYELSAPISLLATSDDSSLQFSFSSQSVSPPAGGTSTATLTVSDPNTCDSGSHTVTLSASANDPGGVAPRQTEQYQIPITVSRTCDFNITVGSPSLSTPSPGSSLTAAVSLQSLNSLASTISLSAQASPNVQNGPTVSFSPSSVPLSAGQSASSTMTAQTTTATPSSLYTLTIAATDQAHAITHTATLLFTVSYSLSFSYTEAQPTSGVFPVTFTATASGGTSPYTYAWTFGDTSTGTGSPVTHLYHGTGTYTAALTARDNSGKTSQTAQAVVVTVPSLAADFGFSPNEAIVGQAVTFRTPVHGGMSPYTMTWDFGDGTGATGATTIHSYQSTGAYAVTLTVTDYLGTALKYSHTFYVVRCFVRGDVNGDSKVDISDLSTVGGAFGATIGGAGWNPSADITGDGVIDISDLASVSGNFGASC